jgi:hypothetical protein
MMVKFFVSRVIFVIRCFDYFLTRKQRKTANNRVIHSFKLVSALFDRFRICVVSELNRNLTPENDERNIHFVSTGSLILFLLASLSIQLVSLKVEKEHISIAPLARKPVL